MVKNRSKIVLVFALALLACVFVGSVAAGSDEGNDLDKAKQIIEAHRSVAHVKLSDNDKLEVPENAKDGVSYSFGHRVSSGGESDGAKATAVATFYLPADDSHGVKQVLDNGDWAVYAGDNFYLALEASKTGFASYIILLNDEAPTSYRIGYDLPAGFQIERNGHWSHLHSGWIRQSSGSIGSTLVV